MEPEGWSGLLLGLVAIAPLGLPEPRPAIAPELTR